MSLGGNGHIDGRCRYTGIQGSVTHLIISMHYCNGPFSQYYVFAQAPEVLWDPELVTTAFDIWSVGVLMFECVTGKVPFPYFTDVRGKMR